MLCYHDNNVCFPALPGIEPCDLATNSDDQYGRGKYLELRGTQSVFDPANELHRMIFREYDPTAFYSSARR